MTKLLVPIMVSRQKLNLKIQYHSQVIYQRVINFGLTNQTLKDLARVSARGAEMNQGEIGVYIAWLTSISTPLQTLQPE